MIELENEKKFWLGQDEIDRLGMRVMPNGRPVDQPNFWFADEKVRNEYMESWSPALTNDDLAFNWVKAGGLDSIGAMERAAAINSSDRRLAGFKIMKPTRSGNLKASNRYYTTTGNAAGNSVDPRFEQYGKYKRLVALEGAIRRAAKEHKINKDALAAVLIYEMSHWEPTGGYPGDAVGEKEGWKDWTSLGVGQMQIQTAREMMNKYYDGMGDELSNRGIGAVLNHDVAFAIRLAAAYMRHLKETITAPAGPLRNGNEKSTRQINDWEAAVAYGVSPTDYQRYKNGGGSLTAEGQKRERAIYGWVRDAANEYLDCANAPSCKDLFKKGPPMGSDVK
ncbi:hypothetical protein ACFPOI_00975 [Nonomuraea angiospora]|uniref:Transglycosylase SLT domain-containing protein n=1 Tax=Nonomuraea angiospora TaxID=46172 RepID=A0ABR9M332_9ACTN|nr:hypothetical protein [Nonomuraea angiospora]MBE1586977.1 hypothetical protein [Nonomuraea angiospora]